MIVTYNSVQLQIEHISLFDQRPVYSEDSTEVLYHRIHIGVHFVINPSATNVPVDPLSNTNDIAATLRQKLLEPRKQLTVDMIGDQKWLLKSPGSYLDKLNNPQPYPCDVKNGPNPISCTITSFSGASSFLGYWECETWIRDCQYSDAILSNRWTMVDEMDSNYYTHRQIEGEAIFNAAYLRSSADPVKGPMSALMPDDFRGVVFPPIMPNFKRERVVVQQSSDGLSLRWSCSDEEQTLKITPAYRAITKIKGRWFANKDISVGTAGIGREGGRLGIAVNPGGFIPRKSVGITLEVWGTRKTTRADLVNALIKAAAAYRFADFTQYTMFTNSRLEVDVVEKYARLEMICSISGISSIGETVTWNTVGAFSAFGIDPTKTQATGFPNTDANGLPENLGDVAVIDDNVATTPPPNSFGTRGSAIVKVWAQILKAGSCDAPYFTETLQKKLPPLTDWKWNEP